MEKLTRLTAKEQSGEQNLSGSYRVTVDINITAGKPWNVDVVKNLAKVLGDQVEVVAIERHTGNVFKSPFDVGDTIELAADFNCSKAVYLDSNGNLIISDKPVASSVEKVGEFNISLPKGTVAEVNSQAGKLTTEVLFSGEEVRLDELERTAYLGILEVPSEYLSKSGF